MSSIYKDKRVSIVCHIVAAIGILPYILLYTKYNSLLFINSHFSAFTDVLMYHITRLPELAYIIFVIILGLFTEKRTFLTISVTLAVCGILIVLFKNYIFVGYSRPSVWFSTSKIDFHQVKGIRLHSNASFPSGHTLAAFATLSLVGFISKKGWLQFILFLLACLSAYSRVYVAQHYLVDVYAGGIIGFTVSLTVFHIIHQMFKTEWWLKPVIELKP